jgi:hypothetical protein
MWHVLDHITGVVSIIAGIWLLLLSYHLVSPWPNDREKADVWHSKYDRISKMLGPALILFGIILALDILLELK